MFVDFVIVDLIASLDANLYFFGIHALKYPISEW